LILVDSNLFIFQYTRKATWKNHSLAWKHMAPNFEADKADTGKVHNIIYLGQHSSHPFNEYFICNDLQTCQDCATLVLSLCFLCYFFPFVPILPIEGTVEPGKHCSNSEYIQEGGGGEQMMGRATPCRSPPWRQPCQGRGPWRFAQAIIWNQTLCNGLWNLKYSMNTCTSQ
jgi:hypothetical protein